MWIGPWLGCWVGWWVVEEVVWWDWGCGGRVGDVDRVWVMVILTLMDGGCRGEF